MTASVGEELTAALASQSPRALAEAYIRAAEAALDLGDKDESYFLLTHAWVHALEAGSELAHECHSRLASAGRA